MSIYDVYETDIDLEEQGVWVQITKDEEVKVAALGNKKHQEAITKLFRPYKTQTRKKTIDSEIEEDLHIKAIAMSILVDWKGFKDREGNELPYSFENAYKLLSDPKMKRFKADIILLSQEAQTFKEVEKDEAVKNSKKSSSGTSTSGTKSKN